MPNLTLHKKGQQFRFDWQPGQEREALRQINAMAADRDCAMDLTDAAVLSAELITLTGFDPERVIGGIDQPGLLPLTAGDPCFEYWRKGPGFAGYIPMDAPMASAAFIDLLNYIPASRPWMNN